MLAGVWALALLSLVHGLVMLVSHIAQNSFPRPLNEQEEQAYLELALQGNQQARQVLIEHNLRLVAHIIKKFDDRSEEFDDLISIGTIGLIKAINTFRPDKTTRLATYASRCIENEILMYFRSKKKKRYECSLYDPIGQDKEGHELCLIDILGTPPDSVPEQINTSVTREIIRNKLSELPFQEQQVLALRFGLTSGECLTQREIAQKMGISRSYVSRIEKRALQRLMEHLSRVNLLH